MSETLRDECIVSLRVPSEPNLMFRAWEVRLSNTPDPEKGEVKSMSIPADLETDYVAVVWDGDVTFEGATPRTSSCANSGRIAVITGGTVIGLAHQAAAARVAVLGIDNVRRHLGNLLSGSHSFSETALQSQDVTFFLRELEFDGDTDWELLEAWDRAGFLLTTVDGPRLGSVAPDPAECANDELDFVLLPPGNSMKLLRGQRCAPTAFILDAWAIGDRAEPRTSDIHIEDGCKLRCWGGGLN